MPFCLQVNRLNVVEQLLDWKADGIITDCTFECVQAIDLIRG